MDALAQTLRAMFLQLPGACEPSIDVDAMAETLALLHDPDGKAGRVPARFRETTHKSAVKELKALANQTERLAIAFKVGAADRVAQVAMAKRLANTVRALHQTGILWLANFGFLDRYELERIANEVAAGHITDRTGADADLLRRASAAARRAIAAILQAGDSPEETTRGAPENGRARVATQLLGSSYKRVTGKNPSLTVNSLKEGNPASGAFLHLVKTAFQVLNIDASAEAYVRKILDESAA